jgi:hypothetical protein
MSGSLRADLVARFDVWKRKADLVLALGTSLAAVGADSIVDAAAKKQANLKGNGAVIISLQRTHYDDVSALRIFGKLDEVLGMLADHMGLHVDSHEECRTYTPAVDPTHRLGENVFSVPYDASTAERSTDASRVVWDLEKGSHVQIKYGPAAGFRGVVTGKSRQGHYHVEFPRIVGHNDEWVLRRDRRKYPDEDPRAPRRYTLGSWWVQSAVMGLCARLPFVSIPPPAPAPAPVAP